MPVRHLKHVRFAQENIFHSAPPTPDLTFSTSIASSTSSSSSGVRTPLSATHNLPDKQMQIPVGVPSKASSTASASIAISRPPSKPLDNVTVLAHRYFEHAALNWDLRDYYLNITRDDRPLSRRALMEPATTPALSFMRITCTYLPWSTKVYPDANGTYVTVGDVLESLSLAFRHNIGEKEFRLLKSAGDQRRATRAYEERYRRLRATHLYESEKRAGMKRIDFLMGRTQFVALSSNGHRPDEWHLNVK
ncbi:hypothetical protein D9619_011116 [Psilocybe cf. subviscida]|uniref:DUF6699 domain-containing protein n=1 Tax=Psilocybe cf. subviscida TaxID=2480587 RepID=A0A8H5F5C9_9AGAR|nr:hypothetical protein D9619_011116 [Psilocybe cf. subviscida]